MARPLSEDKQLAILAAATEIIGSQGLGAPTALIAKTAGVAEGTLFRYYPTKDVLLNQLFVHLIRDLSEVLRSGLNPAETQEQITRGLWNRYIHWGLEKQSAYKAINQLSVSEKLSEESRAVAEHLCKGINGLTENCLFAGLSKAQSASYSEAVLRAIAQVTITRILDEPDKEDAYKAAGFEAFWRGLPK